MEYIDRSKAKILYYDIETAPNLSYVWGQYEQNVIAHVSEWHMLCVSYKWEGQKRAQVCALDDFPEEFKKDPENDEHVAKKLFDLFDEADIVIAHNGDRFDRRKANARFVYHGFGPPSPYKTVDTLKIARKEFMFNSNKLNHLGQHLGLGEKVSTDGFETWAGCMRGDKKAWKTMKKYAKQDVDLLVDVYKALLPWADSHPNLNVYDGGANCSKCGSTNLQRRGRRVTRTGVFQTFQCNDCKGYSRARRSEKTDSPEMV